MSVKEVPTRPLSIGSTKQEAIPLSMSQADREIQMTAGVARLRLWILLCAKF